MGRTQIKKKLRAKTTTNVSTAPKEGPSVDSLLEKAQSLIIQCDYELAAKFTQRILDQQPNHVQAVEMLGLIQLETGQLDLAKTTFTNLASTSNPPPSSHLYLAQLNDEDPHQALRHFQTAIDILMHQLKGKTPAVDGANDTDEEIRQNIVRALVGQVEIWMDPSYDLCFDPAAEQTCEDLLKSALEVSPGNSEALQTLASVRMSQQRPDDAKACLEQAWSFWKDLDADDERLPQIQTRLSLVKLFLELSLFNPALLVLNGIMASDDQLVEAWYLEGWCFFMMAEQAKANPDVKLEELTWEELARDARDCLETCQALHVSQDYGDQPVLEHTKELIAQLEALGIQPSAEDAEDGEGGDWEDVDSEEDGDVDMQA